MHKKQMRRNVVASNLDKLEFSRVKMKYTHTISIILQHRLLLSSNYRVEKVQNL